MERFKNQRAFIDPISIIAVLMLVITLVVGTKVVSDKGFLLNIVEQAAKPKKTGNTAYDKCREDSGRERCNEQLGINVNWKGEVVNEIDTSKVDKNVTKPGDPTCDANGTQYSAGAVVLYGGIGSYATCASDGRWNVGVGTLTDIKSENVPVYAQETYKQAVEKKEADEAKAALELAQEVVIPQQEPVQEPTVTTTTPTPQVGQPIINPIQQKEQQTTVTTVTTPVSPFAGVTASVVGGTIPKVQQTYIPPTTYTPPLLTVPAFTAEDLLRKLPELENLNINDFKEFNYPTINRPDPAIITNKYGIVGAYANDPVRCKYGNGAIKEGDGKYACPTDTFANPILDNSQNISWYDQPLNIPALDFDIESTESTVESTIKKITDPLVNYILDYINKYLPIKFK